jgi:cytoskeletal protein CcmA (bactofilin family)
MTVPKKPASDTTSEKTTLVDEGTHLKGALSSTCPIVVRGTVEGDVDGPAVSVDTTGAISGKISTGVLKSEGNVSGTIDVETAELVGAVASGTVIQAMSLDLKLTARTGVLQLAFGVSGDANRRRGSS